MKKTILLFSIIIYSFLAHAKVPVKAIVEHFTNSKCSVCASRNPGFNSNYNAATNIIRLTIHPSSPYATCPLSINNMVGNDARTNSYGIYGGTPRLVINGTVIAANANYNVASLFAPFQNLTSSFEIKMSDVKFGTDSVLSIISIKKIDTSSLSAALLFVGLAEDTVFVNGGNGETEHYNVLRKIITSPQGISIALPINVGDSITMNYSTMANAAWDFGRIYSIALLQKTITKELIQAERTEANSSTAGINNVAMNNLKLTIYPNPTSTLLKLSTADTGLLTTEIFDLNGVKKASKTFEGYTSFNVATLAAGVYVVKTSNTLGVANFQKIIIK